MAHILGMSSKVALSILLVLCLSSMGKSGFARDHNSDVKPTAKFFRKFKLFKKPLTSHRHQQTSECTKDHTCGEDTCNPGHLVCHPSSCSQKTHQCGAGHCNDGAFVCGEKDCTKPELKCSDSFCNSGKYVCAEGDCEQSAFTCPAKYCNGGATVCSVSQCESPAHVCGAGTCNVGETVCDSSQCIPNELCPAGSCGINTCSGCLPQTRCTTGCELGKLVCDPSTECAGPTEACPSGSCQLMACTQGDCTMPTVCPNTSSRRECDPEDCCPFPCPNCYRRVSGSCSCEIDPASDPSCDACDTGPSGLSGAAFCRLVTGRNNRECCSRFSECKAKALAIYAPPLTDQRLLICGQRCTKSCFSKFTCTLGQTIPLTDLIGSPVRVLVDDTVEDDMDTTSRADSTGNLRSQIEVCDAV